MNNLPRDMDIIDILTIISFYAQMQNIQEDRKYKDYIQSFSARIQEEVNQLHAENDIIMKKLNEIQRRLEEPDEDRVNRTSPATIER